MKTLRNIFLIATVALIAASCDKDGDFLTVTGAGNVALSGNGGDIVLNYNQVDDLALTVYWSDNGEISLSNPLVAAPENASVNTVQFSATEDFATVSEQEADAGEFSMQFTHFELNSILNWLDFEPGVKAPLYIRVESSLGENVAPTYSNTMSVNVTPYVIDMTVAYVIDKGTMTETGATLYSVNDDGVYTGFVGCASWFNWYMREGDGTLWGNDESGTVFRISVNTTPGSWNMWYPGQSGCYYTTVNTPGFEWSALLLSEVNVGGDVTGAMSYNRDANCWTYSYTAAAAGTINIQLSGKGELYDINTGDSASTPTTFGFTQNGDAVEFGDAAGDISVEVPVAGDVTITLNLSDPSHYTCTVEAGGSVEPGPGDEFGDYIYLVGIDDGPNPDAGWNFNNYLRRYDTDSNLYGGACYVNSAWGYQICLAENQWSPAYTTDGGTAEGGSLVLMDDVHTGNIPAPAEGLYLFDVSMSTMTYSTTAITSVQYAGINAGADDSWTLTAMTATAEAGVYTAEVEITQASAWGFKIYVNENWDLNFGGSDGVLYLYGSNITDDQSLAPGSYTLTVDLCAGTYTLE